MTAQEIKEQLAMLKVDIESLQGVIHRLQARYGKLMMLQEKARRESEKA